MTERLVFASRLAPVTLDGGAKIRTYKLLSGLSEAFETTLVTFTGDPTIAAGEWTHGELAEQFPDISVVAVPGRFPAAGMAKRRAQLMGLASTRSWEGGRYRVPAFRRAIHDAVRATEAAIVHYNDYGVALSGPVSGTYNVYASHNVEHRVHQGMVGVTGGMRKAFAELELRRLRREELRLWPQMDLCLAVSELDAGAMRTAGAREVELCLVGIEPVPLCPLQPRRGDEPLRILFVGAGDYQPNEHGIAWFVKNVFPHVRDRAPALLDVVGPPPNRPIRARGVTYRGYVPSLDLFYRDAHVAVIPIFFGSGTRGKVMEAMAYGTPVVSTTLGAEGLQLQPEEHYLRADSAEEFTSALLDLAEGLRSPDAGIATMVRAGRTAAERHFYPNIVRDLVERYRAKLEARRRVPSLSV